MLFIRSYAPFKTFGLGFHGDGRGPTTAKTATSRIWTAIAFGPKEGRAKVIDRASSGTKHIWIEGVRYAQPGVNLTARRNGENLLLVVHMAGANPMLEPASPDIDVHLTLSVGITGGILALSGSMKGDGFPNAEVFIADRIDTRRMLLTYATTADRDIGPMTRLWGDNKREMVSICLAFALNEDGTFR